MKKKLYVTFVTGLLASCLLFLLSVTAGFPFFNGLPKTNVVSAEAVETVDAAEATYTFSVTTPSSSSPVVIGPNRQVDLQDGESVVMQFTIVSCTFSYHTDGILVSKRDGVPTSNPMSSTGAIGWIHNGGGADFSGNVGSYNKDTTGNGATIFSSGNTVRATFTPMQSQLELGVFTIEYKTAGSDVWTLGAKASGLGGTVGRNAQIWLFFSLNAASNASITLTDYTITTTYGANLLDSEDGREAENANNCGLWVYDTIGLAYVHGGSTYTAKAFVEDKVSQKIIYNGSADLYPTTAAKISDGGSAVLEFTVKEASIAQSSDKDQFGFRLNTVYAASNAYAYKSSGGVYFYSRSSWQEFNATSDDKLTGYSVDTSHTYKSTTLMSAGNSVKIVYTPAYGSTDGTFVIYKKSATDADFVRVVGASELGNSIKDSVYITIFANSSATNFTISNYKFYTVDAENNANIVCETQQFAASGTITDVYDDIKLSVKENTMSFTGAGKDYTVYVKENGSYKLPNPTVEGTFIGWQEGEKLYKAGTEVPISENKTYIAVILRDWETVGAAVSVNDFMGLRFESTFNTEDYDKASEFISEYGTLIARVGDIGTADDLTVSTRTAVKKITSTVTFSEADGKTTYAGGISRLLVHNYDVEIVGCGYMVVNYESGAETVYTSVIVRTAKGIAEQCLSDNVYGEDDFEYKVLQAYIDGEEFPVEE